MDNTLDTTPLRYPGQSLHEKLNDAYEMSVARLSYVAGIFLGAAVISLGSHTIPVLNNPWVVVPTSFSACIITFMLTWRHHRKLHRLKTGLKGEQIVGEELNYRISGPDAFVFHDIVFETYNIDHLIVSTRGIFSIETKAVRNDTDKESQIKIIATDDYVDIKGVRYHEHVKQALRNAVSMAELLKKLGFTDIPVHGVLLYPGRWVDGNPRKILVRNQRSFCTHFEHLPPEHDLALVKQMRLALERHIRATPTPTPV